MALPIAAMDTGGTGRLSKTRSPACCARTWRPSVPRWRAFARTPACGRGSAGRAGAGGDRFDTGAVARRLEALYGDLRG